MRDVVWIAATNHIGQIDPALLRGGRFGEKVSFELPSAEDLARHLTTWIEARRVRYQPGFDQSDLIAMVSSTSVADAEAVAQTALNLAISRDSECRREEWMSRKRFGWYFFKRHARSTHG